MVILQLEEQPAVIQAIFAGDSNVKELIEYKQDVNYLDCEKRTPLHAAAFKGDPMITSLLLQNGARVNAKDSKWVTPLHRACSTASAEVVALLLRHDADANARDRLWQTPLHVAAAAGDDALGCVAALLERAPNADVADRAGRTALHHAAHHGHAAVAELLIERGCTVDACDKKDSRPLHYAVLMGHSDIIELLLRYGADINAKDRNQYTPLHVAAATGADPTCRSLLAWGALVDARDAFGNTPLHVACLHGRLDACRHLADAGADAAAANSRGHAPLHVAAASPGGADCLEHLLRRRGADANARARDGRTPLHLTAVHGRFTRSKTLIDHGALIDCPDKNGCTPLHIAAQYGHDLLANTFLSYGAVPTRKGYEGRTPLHMCCLSGYVECARKFVQAGVNLNEVDDTGKTPTHCAAYKGSYECLDLLVSHGADFKSPDRLLRLPIHYAASQGHYQCVFTLVGIGSAVNAADSDGCAPIHLAAAYDLEGKCVEYLLGHKADVRLKDNRGFTPLHYAIAGGNVNGVSMLLNNEQKSREEKGHESAEIKRLVNQCSVDVTPLHLAAKLGNMDILRMMMRHCDDVNVRTNREGATPLILAARDGHAQAVHFLLRFGAKVAVADADAMTAVHYSAKNGHSQGLVLLLHNTEDQAVVDMVDRQHRTALMLAVSGNHIECVQTLLKCGADPNIVDTDEHSCLFRAVVNGQDSVVQLLLSNGARVQATDVNGKTVLHLAAACGHFACVQTIIGHMTEDEARAEDNQQCTALHWACYHGYANCVEYLLEKKIFQEIEGNSFSPVHCATFSGSERCLELLALSYGTATVAALTDGRRRTPLHIAALHGHVGCAGRLIDAGAATARDAVDDDGRTPLIAAAQYGQAQTVELLLNCKADRTARDKVGNTALHWACLKRHSQTALLILEDSWEGDVVNIVNNDNKTPLHISARNGLVNVTQELLRKGASVTAVDNEGLTPALSCAPNNSVAQCLALILQSLPQFVESDASTNVSLLSPLRRLLSPPRADQSSQTARPHESTPRKPAPRKKPIALDSHCFIAEGDDFTVEKQQPPASRDHLGLGLHGSRSETSLVAQEQRRKGAAGGGCRECHRQQRRCADCGMKSVLRRHLTGRSTRAEFQTFISKCLTESSHDYRSLLNVSIDTVAKQLGLFEKTRNTLGGSSKAKDVNETELLLKSQEVCGETKFLIDKSDPVLRAIVDKLAENLECRCAENKLKDTETSRQIFQSLVVDHDQVTVRKKKSKTEIVCVLI